MQGLIGRIIDDEPFLTTVDTWDCDISSLDLVIMLSIVTFTFSSMWNRLKRYLFAVFLASSSKKRYVNNKLWENRKK